MPHLGSLSPAVGTADDAAELERDTFDWYGETFAVADSVSALTLLRMAWDSRQADGLRNRATIARRRARTDAERAAADELDAQAERDELASMWSFLRSTLAPGEWDRFVEVSELAGAPPDAVGELIQTLIGVITARPTRQPSASAGGRSTSSVSSLVPSQPLTPKELQDAELFFAGS